MRIAGIGCSRDTSTRLCSSRFTGASSSSRSTGSSVLGTRNMRRDLPRLSSCRPLRDRFPSLRFGDLRPGGLILAYTGGASIEGVAAMVRRRESAIHSTFIRRILWIMVRMTVLASGSRGNSSILSSATTRILVDAGLSCRELMKRMKAAGEEPTALDAILITHEHKDHVQGMAVTARKLGIPVYLTEPTHRAWIRWMTPQKRITYAEWLA